MSNFLQRLALSASHPGGNIHPVLSPMFSPRAPRVQGDGLEIDENTTPDAQIAQARPGLEAAPHYSPLVKSESADDAQSRAAVPGATEPAKHPDGFPVDNAAPNLADPVGFPKETGSINVGLHSPDGRGFEDQTPSASSREISWTPLLAVTQIPAETSEIQPNHPRVAPAFGSGMKQHKLGAFRRPELPDRQADEIQIHIGRIEVIAAAPVVATTALPKPRDETSSLDKYLRRRDGKAI